ncbi:hypothetical protein Dda_9224 [Drechslerella dactyloides]|uniref:Zn(2)-C6 fungal-type domain-containing protein n=1 Tax=Drechslerella dactyloides TaxID=74499 RepID=A0AAD6IPE2_DREDA|nr:hypothetical protein Dda_9224 [Drechslerella dactyloides]
MSPRSTKPRGLRLSICSTTCSSNGDFSAESVTPSSATTTFSVSPTSSLSVNLPFSTYSASHYAASSSSSVKEEPSTPGLFTPSDDAEENGDSADTESSPPQNELKAELSVEPKVEVKSEENSSSASAAQVPIKRPRGRPRKNPPNPPESKTKATKGRSKTGCLTCRKRKKKCDEGKPDCNNCGKNGIVCEGYSPKMYWKPGHGREGVESHLDRKLLNHFVVTVSSVLSKFGDEKNPFKELLLPLAIDNSGLMHSMLCLAASHLARTDPSVRNAQYHHKDVAIKILKQGINSLTHQEGSVIDDSTVATTIVLCLEAICEGDNTGAHSHHMSALNSVAQKMNERARAKDTEPHELEFAKFFIEFFRYHLILDGVTSMGRRPSLDLNAFALAPPFMPPKSNASVNSHAPLEGDPEDGIVATTLIGILHELFVNISRITSLRVHIRKRKAESIYPTIDELMLGQAVGIDEQVRSWKPAVQNGQDSCKYYYAVLYQQVTWIYLFRTVQRSVPDPKIRNAVDEGLRCLSALPLEESSYSMLLMPVFLLGCAAFDVEQRPEITKTLDKMREAGLQNAIHAQKVVNKIWELMDAEDETSWDWERIIQGFGYDFLLS